MDLYVQKNGNRMYKSTKQLKIGHSSGHSTISFSNTQVEALETRVFEKGCHSIP